MQPLLEKCFKTVGSSTRAPWALSHLPPKQRIPQSAGTQGSEGQSQCFVYVGDALTYQVWLVKCFLSQNSQKNIKNSLQGLGFLGKECHATSSKGECRHGLLSETGLSPAGGMSAFTSFYAHLPWQLLSRAALWLPLKKNRIKVISREEKKKKKKCSSWKLSAYECFGAKNLSCLHRSEEQQHIFLHISLQIIQLSHIPMLDL